MSSTSTPEPELGSGRDDLLTAAYLAGERGRDQDSEATEDDRPTLTADKRITDPFSPRLEEPLRIDEVDEPEEEPASLSVAAPDAPPAVLVRKILFVGGDERDENRQ